MWNAHVANAVGAALLTLGAAMNQAQPSRETKSEDAGRENAPAFRAVAVRYQIKDVERSVAFYTGHLGFKVDLNAAPAFARVSSGSFILWLSGPGSSGARPMPDGRKQEPGGWNRLALEVDDLSTEVSRLKKAGLRFRNDIESGPGGRQIQLEDPDGNPIELFEPAS
jgi:glyoxylase I family protein